MQTKVFKVGIFLCVILFLTTFFYHTSDGTFQNDSENYVLGPVIAEINKIEVDKGGYGLGALISHDYPEDSPLEMQMKENLNGYEYHPYISQIGLQGMVFAEVAHILPYFKIYVLFRICCCLMLAIVLILIVLQLNKKYGLLYSSIFFLFSFLSPWIIIFSRNLYWVEFTWFIPMLLGLLCINYEKKRALIYPLFTVAVFIKCLCGYEYISTIMMTGIMFLMVEVVCNKSKRRDNIKAIFLIGICSVIGFIIAYMIHAYVFGNGDILDGLKQMQVYLIERRTYGNAAKFGDDCTDSLNASVIATVVKYFGASQLFADGFLNLLLLILTIGCLIYQRKVLIENNKFDICMFIVTLLGPLSWVVLAKSHSYMHTHINVVLFYMGWIQTCLYIICKVIIRKAGIRILVNKKDIVIESGEDVF